MIYFVFGRLLCHYVYFGVAKVAAKIVQASGMTKQNTQFLFFIHERSLSYENIYKGEGTRKKMNIDFCNKCNNVTL